jgi:hypothetical protein
MTHAAPICETHSQMNRILKLVNRRVALPTKKKLRDQN